MESLEKILMKAGVDKACEKKGIDFDEVFLKHIKDKKVNPYKEYEWMVLDYPNADTVIHAIPPADKTDTLPWEEWWVQDNSHDDRFNNKDDLHHLVVFTRKKGVFKNKTVFPEDDKVHPPSTAGKTWYWYDDPTHIPYFFWK